MIVTIFCSSMAFCLFFSSSDTTFGTGVTAPTAPLPLCIIAAAFARTKAFAFSNSDMNELEAASVFGVMAGAFIDEEGVIDDDTDVFGCFKFSNCVW